MSKIVINLLYLKEAHVIFNYFDLFDGQILISLTENSNHKLQSIIFLILCSILKLSLLTFNK